MTDEAFALSPISARAALPSEADYDAIREAFMETSRGRWFLGEYAKRNRNADTAMVLDAVARIEQAMAAQKQEPARNDMLIEALAAIRSAVAEAAETASGALNGLQLDEKLVPIRKGTRIIKEISWRWREIGADGRICDLIDSQLVAIEASCTEIAEADGSAALGAAFDLLRSRLDELADGKEVMAKVDERASARADVTGVAEAMVAPTAAMPEPASAQRPEAEAVAIQEAPAGTAFAEPELPAGTAASAIAEPEADPVAAPATEVEPEAVSAPAADAQGFADDLADDLAEDLAEDPASGLTSDLAEDLAQDEAVLEMVAIEMAAPDDSVDDFLPEEVDEAHTTLPPVVEPVAASTEEPPPPAPRLEVAAPPPQILPERAPPVAPEPSLGSTLIASGILPRPKPPSDPLAPIRRMSQAEKIAFFS